MDKSLEEAKAKLKAECDLARNALQTFAAGSLDGSARSGVSLRWALFMLRSNGSKRHLEPVRFDFDTELPLPPMSVLIASLEDACRTPGTPIALAFFGMGGVIAKRGEFEQSAFISTVDVLGIATERMRHWTADGPAGDWKDVTNPGTQYAGYLRHAITAQMSQTFMHTSPNSVGSIYGAPVDDLEA
ncbi:MAG: hypothetical protein KDB00_10920 [Planctomycetales bacterium]|nr:hypothetical protein [Planctomycetales bacterium]